MDCVSKEPRHSTQFKILFWLTQATGITLCVLTIAWVFHFKGGVGWRDEPKLEFNWHTLAFTIGMIYLYGNGIIVYRFLSWMPKFQLKLIHTAVNTLVVVFIAFGMLAVLDSHNFASPKKANWYSMHSWLGILSMAVFVVQWAFSLVIYLYPGTPTKYRTAYMPLHIFLGIATFMCTIATALTGLFGKAKKVKNFQLLPPESLLLNSIALIMVVFTGLCCYLLYNNAFKYRPLQNQVSESKTSIPFTDSKSEGIDKVA